jgi:hypothetical protein
MARTSERQAILRDLPIAYLLWRLHQNGVRALADIEGASSDDEDFLLSLATAAAVPIALAATYVQVALERYLGPRTYDVSRRMPNVPVHDAPMAFLYSLDEARFRQEVRLGPVAFYSLARMLESHDVFKNRSNHAQASVEAQLAVFLAKLGWFGNGASVGILARMFCIAEGTVVLYCKRCLLAILSLEKRVVVWPDSNERRVISGRINEDHRFPRCVGFVDGTLFPVYAKPSLNGEAYYTRKGFYGMAGMVVCDDLKRIIHINLGWPGSAHDARVWSNSPMALNAGKYFSPGEYLLADSGYPTGGNLLSSFRKMRNTAMSPERTAFNTRIAQCRYVNEHAIGLLKGRFQSLRGMRCDIANVGAAATMVYMARCAAVLHNLLLDEGDDNMLDVAMQDCDQTADEHPIIDTVQLRNNLADI